MKLLPSNLHQCVHVSADEIAADPDFPVLNTNYSDLINFGSKELFWGMIRTLSFFVLHKYDNEDDECHYPLMDDLANNELHILS